MTNKSLFKKLATYLFILILAAFFTTSFIRGTVLVKKSEKELNQNKQLEEAHAGAYKLKEIDVKTGQIRWELNAKEGKTENNLQAALIKDISAQVYKDNIVIFNLYAPYGKANASTKEIYLYGNVTASDTNMNFLLNSNQVSLGMGTSIEAQKGFNLLLKDTGSVIGESALINDDQTEIKVSKLKEAKFKDIILSGEKVFIEKEKNGDLSKATISNGGKVVLVNKNNEILSASKIKWKKNGEVEAIGSVIYTSEDKIFKAGYLHLNPDKNFHAKNKVIILHGQTQCYGESLIYENNSLITLSGNPRAIQNSKQITADKIVYNLNSGKIEASGNVKTTVTKSEKS